MFLTASLHIVLLCKWYRGFWLDNQLWYSSQKKALTQSSEKTSELVTSTDLLPDIFNLSNLLLHFCENFYWPFDHFWSTSVKNKTLCEWLSLTLPSEAALWPLQISLVTNFLRFFKHNLQNPSLCQRWTESDKETIIHWNILNQVPSLKSGEEKSKVWKFEDKQSKNLTHLTAERKVVRPTNCVSMSTNELHCIINI